MMHGISAAPVPALGLPFADAVNLVCMQKNSFPCVLYAVGWRESIREYGLAAATRTSDNNDGGHGIWQLTSSYPPNWQDPQANCAFAIDHFIIPALDFWFNRMGQTDVALIKCIAAEFNAGRSGAMGGFTLGNVDQNTTHGNYGHDVVTQYNRLLAHMPPTPDEE